MSLIESVKFEWPKCIRNDPKFPITKTARVLSGALTVPTDLPPGALSYMEERFRHILWPSCRDDGYTRLSREFVWSDDGKTLHYRIVDVPAKKAVNP